MKPWQHGIELDELLEVEKFYERHNRFALSPFMQVKKNTVAEMMHNESLQWREHAACAEIKIAKGNTMIFSMPGVPIGMKHRSDIVVSRAAYRVREALEELIARETGKVNCWWYLFEEDREMVAAATALGFEKVGVKFSTFADIIGVYLRAINPFHRKARVIAVSRHEMIDTMPLHWEHDDALDAAIKELPLVQTFTDHYSNYNKASSWSAVALRGFTSDSQFIIKPNEMNDKWQQKHKDEKFELQDTSLRASMPFCSALAETIPGAKQRIRLMRLAPGGGELERHTDQTDPESGIADGRVARIHIPLVTNDKVIFTVWGQDGVERDSHMETGHAFYLDTRKPHKAVNGGKEDRIHLVIDVFSSKELRDLINEKSNLC